MLPAPAKQPDGSVIVVLVSGPGQVPATAVNVNGLAMTPAGNLYVVRR